MGFGLSVPLASRSSAAILMPRIGVEVVRRAYPAPSAFGLSAAIATDRPVGLRRPPKT